MHAMKSQYPVSPVTYQNSEPANYLQNFSHVRQITPEKAEKIKSDARQDVSPESGDQTVPPQNEAEDGLASFFYSQSFTPSNED
jgi:hypothetical protein